MNTDPLDVEVRPLALKENVAPLAPIRDFDPDEALDRGIRQAKALMRMAKANPKMVTTINGKDWPAVEIWEACGSFNHLGPRTVWTRRMDDGGFEARVELVDETTGIVVAAAEAECSRKEEKWAKKLGHSVRSMAQTRATGKAFRMKLAWIVVLAGMEPTPREEITGDIAADLPPEPKPRAREKPDKRNAEIALLIEEYAKVAPEAAKVLQDDDLRHGVYKTLFGKAHPDIEVLRLKDLTREEVKSLAAMIRQRIRENDPGPRT
jgi:hypothetical protein